MRYDAVCDAVAAVRKRTDSVDPFTLCRELKILLLARPLGKEPDAIKGFYYMNRRIKTITVNSDLPEVIQRIIIAHEIGHAELHASRGINEFHDVGMFDESSAMEKEANLFAAEFQLNDSDVFEAMNSDTTFSGAAAILGVPMEVLDFKFRMMKWKGYKLIDPPIYTQGNYLRNFDMPKGEDDYYDC